MVKKLIFTAFMINLYLVSDHDCMFVEDLKDELMHAIWTKGSVSLLQV